jgi:hypothetical protein
VLPYRQHILSVKVHQPSQLIALLLRHVIGVDPSLGLEDGVLVLWAVPAPGNGYVRLGGRPVVSADLSVETA